MSIENLFFEVLQSYCAPVLALAIFIAIVAKDTLFEKRIKNLFVCESLIILLIIAATWADRCLAAMYLDGAAWKLRTMTTFINFTFSPMSPLLLMMIYNKKPINKQLPYFIPMCINLILCIVSLFNGCIFNITPENVYSRGSLFFVPFVISGLYLLGMILFSASQKQIKINRREETLVLILIMLAIITATMLEVIFVKRFMLWSTTCFCVIIYFMVLSRQKIKFDDLTGTFSRTAYSKRVEHLSGDKSCIIAMIDIDGLKIINDTLGHTSGDEAIFRIANGILKETGRNMQLYRVGGDEFVLIALHSSNAAVGALLDRANASVGAISGLPLSFSYGIACLSENDIYEAVRNQADERLYQNKALRKEKAKQKESLYE